MKTLFTSLLLFMAASPVWAQTGKTASYKTQQTIPAVQLIDWSKQPFFSNKVQQPGKTLVLVYFSPTCSHCLDFTENLTGKLKQFKNVQFLFVSAYSVEEIKTFAITRGLTKMPNFKVGQDPEFKLGGFYELKEIPSIFVYGKNGKLKKTFDSKVKMEDLIVSANE